MHLRHTNNTTHEIIIIKIITHQPCPNGGNGISQFFPRRTALVNLNSEIQTQHHYLQNNNKHKVRRISISRCFAIVARKLNRAVQP